MINVAALIVHVIWIDAPEALVTGTYSLGCLGGGVFPSVRVHAGIAAFALLLAGGVVYIVGAIVFGYHEVWHCNVCVAAALHYVAIGTLIL